MKQTVDKIEDILADFQFLDNLEDKFRYIVDLGKKLEPIPEEMKITENLVPGCMSQVWLELNYDENNNVISFLAESDAHIVKGLVAILLSCYNEKSPQQILDFDIDNLFKSIGLDQQLSANRRNGFQAMVKKIKSFAQTKSS